MPTLVRLLATLGVIALCGYGVIFTVATCLQPQPRQIIQAVALPRVNAVKTGRSAATDLDRHARHLTQGHLTHGHQPSRRDR